MLENNNNNISNMTTFDVEIGHNINDIYKKQLELRSLSESVIRNKRIADVKPKIVKQKSINNKQSSQQLNRSGTVPGLRDDLSEPRAKSKKISVIELPPKAPSKPSDFGKTKTINEPQVKLEANEKRRNSAASHYSNTNSRQSDQSAGRPSRQAKRERLQQSHSAFDILRNKSNNGSELGQKERYSHIQETQAGNDWT